MKRCQLLRWCLLTPNHILFPHIVLTFHPHLQQISSHYVNGALVGHQCSHTSFPKFHTFLTIFPSTLAQHPQQICHCLYIVQVPTSATSLLDLYWVLHFFIVVATKFNFLQTSSFFWIHIAFYSWKWDNFQHTHWVSFVLIRVVFYSIATCHLLCSLFESFLYLFVPVFFYVFLCCVHLVMFSIASVCF